MSNLNVLKPYLDPILQIFYKELLSHKYLAAFFGNDEHIQRLMNLQKKNFLDSLHDSEEEFIERYKRLGKKHFDLRLPAIDFLKGTEIFRSSFIDYTITELNDITLIKEILEHFRLADISMCRGYLESQIPVDREYLQNLMLQIAKTEKGVAQFGLPHLAWLQDILSAIESNDVSTVSNLKIEDCTIHRFLSEDIEGEDLAFTREHFEDLHQRIHIDAQSLFYFLEKGDYPEVLSIYSSLLNVYKMTLAFMGNYYIRAALLKTQSELADAHLMLENLKEIIPICSNCHKIRDDNGRWEILEKYIQRHSRSKFSHGLCPDCMDRLYGDFLKENKSGN